ncbi:hypothetical protein D3C81_1986000 [compost metagenome]
MTQSIIQISDQVFLVLEANRDPDQPLGHPCFTAQSLRHTRLCGRSWMTNQGLSASETDSRLEKMQGVDKAEGPFATTLQYEREG